MLQRLLIQNYAIIDHLDIPFSRGLNIITGETGAGKSILMGALSLILGERADSAVLQVKDKKCIVEGFFGVQGQPQVGRFLMDNDLDMTEELVLRREISSSGKSRAFINDTPVNLNQLKGICYFLVDLHQQFDTQELGSSGFQQDVLDVLAGNGDLLQKYLTLYHRYIAEKKALEEMKERQSRANVELDYHRFLLEELEELGLKANELEELEEELKLLSNAENIKSQLDAIRLILTDSELPVLSQLKSVGNKLTSIQGYHKEISSLLQRLLTVQVEIRDIAGELERINRDIDFSEERIQQINERVSLGYKLLKKHNVRTTAELLTIKEGLQHQLSDIINIGDLIEQQEILSGNLLQQCMELAGSISNRRKKTIGPFSEKINGLLKQVGMPNAGFRVELKSVDQIGESGLDKTTFLFNANLPPDNKAEGNLEDTVPGRFEPLKKVASGGELSRLVLCIKSLVARHIQLPTMIFDEIDTGISGEAARQVGIIMKELSGFHQVISITHQPQIAAKADTHYLVFKAVDKNRIVTSVQLLNSDERITAIARMLSGEKPTAAALQNAREMVGN